MQLVDGGGGDGSKYVLESRESKSSEASAEKKSRVVGPSSSRINHQYWSTLSSRRLVFGNIVNFRLGPRSIGEVDVEMGEMGEMEEVEDDSQSEGELAFGVC